MKVTTKILLPLCTIIILGMAFIAYQAFKLSSASMYDTQQELKTMAVRNTISELNGIHEFNVLNAISLSQTGLFQPYLTGTPEEIQANTQGAIDRIVNMRKTYSYVMLGVVDTNGVVLQHTERDLVGTNVSQEYMFKNAMRGQVKAGLPYLFKGDVVYAVSAPVYKTGTTEIIGVVFNTTKLDDTFSERIPLGKKGSFMVADVDGNVFMNSNQSQVLKVNLHDYPWGKQIMNNKKGHVTFDQNGEGKIAIYDIEPETGWIAITALDEQESQATSVDIGKSIMMIAIIVTILIVVVTWYCIFRMRKSLIVSVDFARDIANGKLDTQIRNTSKDEIGELANSLQNIAHVLLSVISEYARLEKSIKQGELLVKANPQEFSGEFSNLIKGTNAIIDNYLTVINNIPSPVVVLDSSLHTRYINAKGIELVGSDYFNKTCKSLFNREDDGTTKDGLQNALRTKQAHSGETVSHTPRGKLDILYTAIPLVDKDTAQVNAVLQLITDITAIKASQQTILHVAEQATNIASQVASASQELASQLHHSEQIAVSQADRASIASNIMHAMDGDVGTMSSMAQDASESSIHAKNEAQNGAGVVSKAIESITVVEQQSQNLILGMQKLNDNANSINEVITTISDIADQTNLLALNAAIEAARAGESGRGFAVVADEVRKLAEKTMASTVQVQNAITTIQQSVAQSVDQVNQSAKEVHTTSQLVNQTGSVFQSIMGMVEQSSNKAQDIAKSSINQTSNSHKVNTALTEVNELAAQTAVSMQESINAVSKLSSQSRALSDLIDTMQK